MVRRPMHVQFGEGGYQSTNWYFLAGACILLGCLILAFVGPFLVSHDPLERVYILQLGNRMVGPPFPPFASPDFPLGSDRFGRDLLSQLLYGIWPTLLLVGVVTLLRLILGTVFGILTGWEENAVLAEGFMALSLAVPVIFVALGFITAIGPRNVLPAFIIGMTATGWAETGQLVRNSTRIVRKQEYIEAARAIGQSEFSIILRHVVRQVLPVIWLMSALEAATVLLAVATLGYLGYYIGGDAWVMVTDFTAQRISSAPELGQLLGVTAEAHDQPWGMLFVGSFIYIVILGFSLLGNGIRMAYVEQARRRSYAYRLWMENVGQQLGARVISTRKSRFAVTVAVFLVLGLALALMVMLRQDRTYLLPAMEQPGGNLWSVTRRDAAGTLRSANILPANLTATLAFSDSQGISGGPVVAGNGTLYVSTNSRKLYALQPDRETLAIRWSVNLDEVPIGAPALDATGNIYIVDRISGLTAYTSNGGRKWRILISAAGQPLAGPLVENQRQAQPIIFITLDGYIVAVESDGHLLWKAIVPYGYLNPSTRISLDGKFLFFKDIVIDTHSGDVLLRESPIPTDQFITGVDGAMYLQSETSLLRWQQSGDNYGLVALAKPDYMNRMAGFVPSDGFVIPGRMVGLLMGNEYVNLRMAWLDEKGHLMATMNYPQRMSQLLALDRSMLAVICGNTSDSRLSTPGAGAECIGVPPGADQPAWKTLLPYGKTVNGAALIAQRLYITTDDGFLYILEGH